MARAKARAVTAAEEAARRSTRLAHRVDLAGSTEGRRGASMDFGKMTNVRPKSVLRAHLRHQLEILFRDLIPLLPYSLHQREFLRVSPGNFSDLTGIREEEEMKGNKNK